MDPRPRNPEGQFSPENGGGLSSSTMAAAYNPAVIAERQQQQQPQLSPVMETIRRHAAKKRGVVEETSPSGPSDTVLSRKFVSPRRYLLERAEGLARKVF